MRAALDRLHESAAHAALDRLLSGFSVETVLREIVMPYLRELGDRWERGEASVAQEHLASQVLRGRRLGLARGWDRGSGPRALLACMPGEQHDLGLIVFASVCATAAGGSRSWAPTRRLTPSPTRRPRCNPTQWCSRRPPPSASKAATRRCGASHVRCRSGPQAQERLRTSRPRGVQLLDRDPLDAAQRVASRGR